MDGIVGRVGDRPSYDTVSFVVNLVSSAGWSETAFPIIASVKV